MAIVDRIIGILSSEKTKFVIKIVELLYYGVLAVIAFCIFIGYTFKVPSILIDQNNLALLIILLLIPLIGNIDKIKLGNLLEVEMRKKALEALEKTEKLKEQTKEEAPRIKTTKEPEKVGEEPTQINKHEIVYDDIKRTATVSLEAALIKLSINIEKALSNIYSLYNPEVVTENWTMMKYIEQLWLQKAISPQLYSSLRDFLNIRNQVVHGRASHFTNDVLTLYVANGLNILQILDNVYDKKVISHEK